MKEKVKAVHYINQFFAGLGGEDKAEMGLQARDGAAGPGVGLEKSSAGQLEIVKTIICGDNFFQSHREEVLAKIAKLVREASPDVFIAGPAFNAGRYGIACREAAEYVRAQSGIPTVTAMFRENPALGVRPFNTYVLPTEDSVLGMGRILPELARFACRLGAGESIGEAEQEGYFPRGFRYNVALRETAAARAVVMLKEKLGGKILTEIPLPAADKVTPPSPVADLAKATVVLATDGGLVPKGNPDRLESAYATKWFRYSMAGLSALEASRWESIHGGCDVTFINQDPHRLLPLDTMRSLVAEGKVGRLDDYFYTTTGNGTTIANAVRIGKEIAAKIKESGANAVMLTST
ncbi:MAG: glycine/betaine/sarcosine/D-proline family reductase selenoprotein B [Chloroflexi bacterium]|nr:glycine/betaine/sarcosine/D-proline family reductase selenoprotein B [Chloroflexota bacterium]